MGFLTVCAAHQPILLLDKGWSCAEVAEALFLDDDTIRN
jgi:hypothetical protein